MTLIGEYRYRATLRTFLASFAIEISFQGCQGCHDAITCRVLSSPTSKRASWSFEEISEATRLVQVDSVSLDMPKHSKAEVEICQHQILYHSHSFNIRPSHPHRRRHMTSGHSTGCRQQKKNSCAQERAFGPFRLQMHHRRTKCSH